MGFPIELAKEALIATKNSGLDVAVEKLFALQDELAKDTAKNELLKQKANILKPVWVCSACTFENHAEENDSHFCMVCENPAPQEAYYTKEEIEQMEKDQQRAIEAQIQKEEELRSAQAVRQSEVKDLD